jgi:hypothetical protein
MLASQWITETKLGFVSGMFGWTANVTLDCDKSGRMALAFSEAGSHNCRGRETAAQQRLLHDSNSRLRRRASPKSSSGVVRVFLMK